MGSDSSTRNLDNTGTVSEHDPVPSMKSWKRRDRTLHPPLRAWKRRPRIRPGTLPGTLIAPEGPQPPARITLIRFSRDAFEERQVSLDEALADMHAPGVTWINVDGLDPRVLSRLGERFSLHPLALEDAMNVPQRPKAERYDKHYFLVLRSLRRQEDGLVEEQISVFFGEGWVITIQEAVQGDSFGSVRAAIRHGRGRTREAGADYLAYLLVDSVVDAYFPVVETISERMAQLEQEVVATNATTECLIQLQRTRHDLLTLRRAVWPIREEVGVLVRDESRLVTPETRLFLRDAYDHAVQALELVESLRETATSVMEIYLSAQNQRLNEVMKVLTVISTLFIPLTFIASIYGMNFQFMPELQWRYGYLWALGLMTATAAGLVAFFKHRGWW
jgi:magnesium transporter